MTTTTTTTAAPAPDSGEAGPDPGPTPAPVPEPVPESVPGPVPWERPDLSEHDLLAAARAEQVAGNRAEAARLTALEEFRRRRERDFEARRAEDPHFTMTPLRETIVEAAPLLGAADGRLQGDLGAIRALHEHFPGILDLVLRGQLDLYRARLVCDPAMAHLPKKGALPTFAALMTAWFLAHLEGQEIQPALVTKTPKQINNKVGYLIKKLRPKDAEDAFKRKFRERSAALHHCQDGMANLCLTHDLATLTAANHRLDLIARQYRRDGDPRTLAQLRVDLAADLLLGRLTITSGTDDPTGSGDNPIGEVSEWPRQRWARPIINVTVPIQTLMGLSDDPAVLSGGTSIPATLAQWLAQDPHSTWYRMLTDPAGRCVELSTTSYQPTQEIWRTTVADWGSCHGPTCTVPATDCECDHRVPWPKGKTSSTNIWPGCKRDHQAKHAPGFGITQRPDGTWLLRTRAGFEHPTERAEQPTTDDWDTDFVEIQPTASEIHDALALLAEERAQMATYAARQYEQERLEADLRASYPDADDNLIWLWLHDDDPDNHLPSLTRTGTADTTHQLHRQRTRREAADAGYALV